jgi:hypothetical protein
VSGLDYDRLKNISSRLGYPFYDTGDYNLNIIGIRTKDARSNLFNDWLCFAFRQNDYPLLLAFQATTDPGVYWRQNPMNIDGTAIVVPGHYPKMWTIGKHRGKYDALVQRGIVRVWRDNNKDEILDMDPLGPVQDGYFGINLHHGGVSPGEVNQWSAGCQVFAKSDDFDLAMAVIRRSVIEHGPYFSYTLLTETDAWG